MKINIFQKSLLLFFLITISFSAIAQSDAGGPPKKDQLIGYWKMKNVARIEKMNVENPWPQKYQWFAFYDNGKIYSMMTDQDYNYSSKELKEIFDVLPKDKTPNYKLLGQFVLIDNPEIKDYEETWGVNLFAKDINDFLKKGNLLMTLDDGSGKGNVIYYRLLERIK
jgi:hypothetical protein